MQNRFVGGGIMGDREGRSTVNTHATHTNIYIRPGYKGRWGITMPTTIMLPSRKGEEHQE